MRQAIVDLLSSKKAIAALLATAAAIAGRFGFDLDTAAIATIIAPLIAYVVGQGIADHGKEAAQITADAPAKPSAIALNVEAAK